MHAGEGCRSRTAALRVVYAEINRARLNARAGRVGFHDDRLMETRGQIKQGIELVALLCPERLAVDAEFHRLHTSGSACSRSHETYWRIIRTARLGGAYVDPRRSRRRTPIGCSAADSERAPGFQESSGRIDLNDLDRMRCLAQAESRIQLVIEDLGLFMPVDPYLNTVDRLSLPSHTGNQPGRMDGGAAVCRQTEIYSRLVGIGTRVAGVAGGIQKCRNRAITVKSEDVLVVISIDEACANHGWIRIISQGEEDRVIEAGDRSARKAGASSFACPYANSVGNLMAEIVTHARSDWRRKVQNAVIVKVSNHYIEWNGAVKVTYPNATVRRGAIRIGIYNADANA